MNRTLTAERTETLVGPVSAVGPAGVARLLDGPPDLSSHVARLGRLPDRGAQLIDLAQAAGLTGRGGAGFPTARKLSAVAAGAGPRVVVANGTEGEPLSAKDKTLLVRSPHLVLDGIDAAARAVRANRRILCIERGNPAVHEAVRIALAERNDRRLEVVLAPRRYISGQEAALVDLLNGGPGRPTLDRPFETGVSRRPTLVDNVETLAHLALVARFGPDWYRSVGTPADPGTTLLTLGGAVKTPGIYEVPHGISLRAVLAHAGVGPTRAVLVGGYFGRWLPARIAESLTISRQSLGAHDAGLGCGVIAVIDDDCCAVAELARVAEWYAQSSAGQCGACTWGLRDLAAATGAIHQGSPDPRAPADVRRWTAMVRGRGACRLPDGAAAFLESGIDVFAEEIAQHQAGLCTRPDRHLLPTPTPQPWP
ncbi:MAG TPA: NADH-ubiquinone oxidoreductase-F iron-sulfur binding region domain-containing protein [Acidimicrobiales bacterium]|jgi:NADH:ubiquinone oxidoreductase subunit F (NADH-binding)|nr:NADH-ubiquinone oxidoreductase-F iron-sulfur binding region domain-containing protein [Acidimicrobiales bacterium]